MLLQVEQLKLFVNDIFVSMDVASSTAKVVTDHLVLANLTGHDSHGVGMVPSYVHGLQRGLLNPDASVDIVRDNGSVVVLDGNGGFGQLIGIQATKKLIELTGKYGLACVGLRNSYHLG